MALIDDTVAIILAAGKNKRMKTNLPKAMHKVGGVPMIGLIRDALDQIGVKRRVVTVGFGAEYITGYFGDWAEYAYQHDQKGTGHALLTALDYLGDYSGRVLVLYGDMPLIRPDTLTALIGQHMESGAQGTLAYADLRVQNEYGRIIRNAGGDLVKIVEMKDASEEEALITEVNIGLYCFDAAAARSALGRLTTDNAQGEMYLTDVFAEILAEGGRVGLYQVADDRECLGANDRAELAELNRALYRDKCAELMLESGVTIIDPDAVYIDRNVVVGMDTVIYPGCVIEGRTVIGENCEIGPNARIRDSHIGDRTKVEYSVVQEASTGDDVSVGPFANLRPGTSIGGKSRIGDFVEIKNSVVGEDVRISHLAYIGDADVGSNVNIGCGAITCNYDGRQKYRTKIGANAFIGSNANLVAPVTVNDNAYVASGSTVTFDVPEDALAIARGRQVIKENWVSRKGLGRG